MVKYQNKKKFEKLLEEYQQVPKSKQLIQSMARFESMYKSPGAQLTIFTALTGLGDPYGAVESAQVQRAEIYNTKKDLIKAANTRQGKTLILTSKGRKVYFQKYPLARLRKKRWDGNWTLVSYDIPSSKKQNYLRNRLRYNLKNFGFGKLHQSLMVSPLPLEEPIQEFIEGEKLEEFAVVMRSERIWGFSDEEIARKAYELNDLELLYEELDETFEEACKNKKDLKRWRSYFLAVDNSDPQLPKELLPDYWLGDTVRKKFTSSFSLFERIFDR